MLPFYSAPIQNDLKMLLKLLMALRTSGHRYSRYGRVVTVDGSPEGGGPTRCHTVGC